MKHGEITERVIKAFYEVYNELGHGFLESVYEEAMSVVLAENGLNAQRQVSIPVWFRARRIGNFCADLIVEDAVLIELKAARGLDSAHESQILNYLRATEIEIGLLMNFGAKAEFKRFVFDNYRKHNRDPKPLSAADLLTAD